jgi:HlyD family secretion protein
MSNKRPPVGILILIGLIILAVAGYLIWKNQTQKQASALTASGTIETVENNVSPEISGKVVRVNANEGDTVAAGDVLIELDGAVLKAQRKVAASSLASANAAALTAKASLASAQAQLELVRQNSLNADKTGRIRDWKSTKPSEFDQPNWYFNLSEEQQNAENQVTAAADLLKMKTQQLRDTEAKFSNNGFLSAEKELLNARQAFNIAKKVLDMANGAQNYAELKDEAEDTYDTAKKRLTDAQDAFDDLLTSKEADEILSARAALRVAQETYDTALDYSRSYNTGESSLELAVAETAVDQAKAAGDQAVVVAAQAQANLDLLDAQLKQLTIVSPASGIVLTRLIEPGDVVTPGYSAMTIGDLQDLTITVYVPEDRIGLVALGQDASVSVDSYPNEGFSASVVYISDKAEFTPRNVQTVEGRKNTVFAVKLKVNNPAGKLKPGMPADVIFK